MTYPMPPDGQQPDRGPMNSPAVLIAIVCGLILLVGGVIGAMVYANGRSDDTAAPASSTPNAPAVTVTATHPGPTSAPQTGGSGGSGGGATQPTAPAISTPPDREDPGVSGADWQGFVGSYARCNAANDPAVFIGYTNRSQVVVCRVGENGGLYYKGFADGSGKEISFPSQQGTTYIARSGSYSYVVSRSSLRILEDGREIGDEPMISSWSG